VLIELACLEQFSSSVGSNQKSIPVFLICSYICMVMEKIFTFLIKINATADRTACRDRVQLRHVDSHQSMINAINRMSGSRQLTPRPPNGSEPRVGEGNVVADGDVAHLFSNTLQSGSKETADR